MPLTGLALACGSATTEDSATSTEPLTANQQAKLVPNDGEASDRFSYAAVDVDGDTAIVGAWGDDDKGSNAGAAYVFVKNGGTWSQQAKLTASDGGANDYFGVVTAVEGDTAIVGAYQDDNWQGSAYVFVRNGTTWTQQAKLTAGDPTNGAEFGCRVGISGDTVIVGARWRAPSGAAYVFTRSGTTWSQQAKLTSDATAGGGVSGGGFGWSVDVSGDTALVSAFQDDITATDQGSLFVFTRSGATWSQQAKLVASDAGAGHKLGYWVALQGNTVLAGAPFHGSGRGAGYVFFRSGTAWSEQGKLLAADGAAGDNLGNAVAVHGDVAILGAEGDDIGTSANQGSAYLFTRTGNAWSEAVKLAAADGTGGDQFGNAVSLSNGVALAGAYLDNPKGSQSGSAYVFDYTNGTGGTGGTGGTATGGTGGTATGGTGGTAAGGTAGAGGAGTGGTAGSATGGSAGASGGGAGVAGAAGASAGSGGGGTGGAGVGGDGTGASATGGAAGPGGSESSSEDEGGCGCRLSGQGAPSSQLSLLFVAAGASLLRRRRRAR
ncbi:MAG: FG-GAP repeat protein [Polyangiaceae bacterium]|nr:FG-GAP repeat protein [Polyangiaceae bacterium]